MPSKYFLIVDYLLLFVFFIFFALGCASFPGRDLPIYSYEQISHREPKPSIDYDAKFLTLGRENAAAVRIFQEEIEKVFNRSNAFSKFSAGIGTERYHLSMEMRNEGNVGLAFVSGFISGLTFTIIPAYARDDYILSVDVKKDNQVLKRYRYEDHMNTWIQLFLIFLTPTHLPGNVVKKVMDNMILNFLYDLENDNI